MMCQLSVSAWCLLHAKLSPSSGTESDGMWMELQSMTPQPLEGVHHEGSSKQHHVLCCWCGCRGPVLLALATVSFNTQVVLPVQQLWQYWRTDLVL